MSNPKKFTAEDIERYHHGGMTAAEMHQLEKAALDDPMLADALEGYRFSPSPTAELANLQSRLQQRIGKEQKSNRVFRMQPWLRIAALFILIAGGGWLVFQTLSPADADLATRRSSADKQESQTESSVTDSASPVLQQAPQTFAFDSTGTTDVASLKKEKMQKQEPERGESASAPPAVLHEPVADAGIGREVDTSMQAQLNEVVVGRAATMKAEAPPAAPRGRTDSLLDRQALAKRRMMTDTGRKGAVAAAVSSAAPFATDSSAQPEGGWAAFEAYIAKNKKPFLPLNKKQAVPQMVELAFTIDEKGRPVHIVITKSLNKESDEEAIRLLKEGPNWKGKNGKVRIPFVQ